MPTESQVLAWIAQNWPSVAMTAMLCAAYLRLHNYTARLEKTEASIRRVLKVCAKMHPENGAALFNDDQEGQK